MTEETHSNEVVDNTTNEVVENKNELKVIRDSAYEKAYTQFLYGECCADYEYMDSQICNRKYMIDSRTRQPYKSYRYVINLSRENDLITIVENGKEFIFKKSKFLSNRQFKDDIQKYYDKMNLFVKIYQDRRNKSKWIMNFYW